jgi:hypothetical protein
MHSICFAPTHLLRIAASLLLLLVRLLQPQLLLQLLLY